MKENSIKVVNIHFYDGEGEYIGRGTPLGNPFYMADERDRDYCIQKYDDWLLQKHLEEDNPQLEELQRLYNKWKKDGELTLVCHCKPRNCHGDIIKYWLEGMELADDIMDKIIDDIGIIEKVCKNE